MKEMEDLRLDDPEMCRLIEEEEKRQRETIDLYPSENYASRAILQAQGSSLTTKYSEGYCEFR